jgi:hypothetical protein
VPTVNALLALKLPRRTLSQTVPSDLHQYIANLRASVPAFLRPRRFVSNDNWADAAKQDGSRYLAIFREREPDLAQILTHRRLLIHSPWQSGSARKDGGRRGLPRPDAPVAVTTRVAPEALRCTRSAGALRATLPVPTGLEAGGRSRGVSRPATVRIDNRRGASVRVGRPGSIQAVRAAPCISAH